MTGVDATGFYLNPINASNQCFGCHGATIAEHLAVYWIGPLLATAATVYLKRLLLEITKSELVVTDTSTQASILQTNHVDTTGKITMSSCKSQESSSESREVTSGTNVHHRTITEQSTSSDHVDTLEPCDESSASGQFERHEHTSEDMEIRKRMKPGSSGTKEGDIGQVGVSREPQSTHHAHLS